MLHALLFETLSPPQWSPPTTTPLRYGFNPGSSLIIDNRISAQIAARAAVTTTLSGATGGLTSLALGFVR